MNSKHFLATIGIAILSTIGLQAEVLTPGQALTRARGGDNLPSRLRSKDVVSSSRLIYTESTEGQPAVYLFDLGNSTNGYMVLSADDIAPAILGYSDDGVIDADNLNPELRYWLEEYGRQIQWARANGATSSPDKAYASAKLSTIAPMVTTKWNQSSPFNDQCPIVNNTKMCHRLCSDSDVTGYEIPPLAGRTWRRE